MTKIIFSIISRGSQISFWNYYGIKFFCLLNPHIGFKAGIFFTTKKVHFLRIFFCKKFIIYYREKYIFSAKHFFFISYDHIIEL